VKKQVDKLNNAIFLVTEEHSCPIYNVGEELKVENFCLSVPAFKPQCLYLSQSIMNVITTRATFSGLSRRTGPKTRFDCGGCQGLIYFEFKKEKDFATLQMKLLIESELRRRKQHLDRFFSILRNLDVFEALDDDALIDLIMLLEMKNVPIDRVILKKDEPGSHLFIILDGRVAVIDEDGSRITEFGQGAIFGEMSLLSDEPVTNAVYTIADTQVAMLSLKNLRHVLKKYPVLQIFLFKLLVDRAQTMTLRSGNITSGMSGELAEISIVDLLQLINSAQKTGTIDLILEEGKAVVCFKEGEIVQARFKNHRDKDAIYAMLGVKSGRFTYTKGIAPGLGALPPIGGFIGLIMEGLQRIDEDKD
jgi:CRP-like cAMP-binding protein